MAEASDSGGSVPLAQAVARYVTTHRHYDRLTKEEVAQEAALVLLTDPTAGMEAARLLPTDVLLDVLTERGALQPCGWLAPSGDVAGEVAVRYYRRLP